jgi:beta-glucosidase-like glycosyl hydrolase/CubicO group peptidase (beta-lactamase class C family)
MRKLLILCLVIFVHHSVYSQDKRISRIKVPKNKVQYKIQSSWADSVFNSLTPDERIAQLFMIAAYSNRDDAHTAEIANLIKTYNLGGIIFFQGGPIRQARMTNIFQSQSRTPLLISIDGEWGLYMRLDSTQWFPRHMMLGALRDNQLIYLLGVEFARQMKVLGIHINFAPVVDINNNPLNPVISNRSFGEDREDVALKGIAYSRGMQENGVLAVAKHFPGHGDTDIDSHLSLPTIKQGFARIDSLELYPFKRLIENHVGGIMVGHLKVPGIDSSLNSASSLSPLVINGLLRNKLNFKGLVFTDALNMKGAADLYPPGEIEVRALMAGNDVLLMPSDIPVAINAIKKAIIDGRLLQSQIDSSCWRVLKIKEWAGLANYKSLDLTKINENINTNNAIALQRKIVESSVTVVKNNNNIIPLKGLDTLRLAVVLTGTSELNQFSETLSLYNQNDVYFLPKGVDSTKIDSMLYLLRHYNLVIVSTHNTDSRSNIRFGLDKKNIEFIDKLSENKKVILNLMATPYALSLFRNINKMEAIIVSYHDMPAVRDISAQMIFGGVGALGKLPVTASVFPLNTSYTSSGGIRLRYAIPEELGIKRRDIDKVDTIVNEAIRLNAMPGCQILAAKNGVVFFNKSYGYFTYDSIRKVTNSDIYDLASVTKIAATVPAVMHLYEKGELKLKNRLSSYLHELRKTNKKNLILMDILTHQAQLQSYLPFHLNTIEAINKNEKLYNNTYSENYPYKLASNLYFNKNTRFRENLFTNKPDLEHGVKVADDLYISNSFTDSIYNAINQSALLPEKQYKYSDLGFYYMYRAIERITKQSFNEYVENNFYKKIGASTLGYLPLNRIERDRIVPTENDMIFRKQVVQGYVHDQTTAMIGGVSGEAGLFSNANDLAKLMQLFLNNGSYGGEEFFKPHTVEYFTSCPFCKTKNRRGIGFDKPDLTLANGPTCKCVSEKSYGHTGFTGTYAWVDPETGLLYIFLSNRVYPDASNTKLADMNVRTRIMEVLVNAVKESEN